MEKQIMEMVIFQTKEDVVEDRFLQSFHELSHTLKRDVPGFIKRSLTKDPTQDKWVEMIWWTSMDTAKAALEKLPQMATFQRYCSALHNEGMMMFHLEEKA